jgi:ribosome maturation factor RimP
VGIHECTQLSRQLSPTLDVEDPIASAYELEVSTPGIERPVQSEADFQRFAGCEIRVKPYGVEARKRVKGTLLGVQDGLVRVRLAPTGGAATRGSAGTRSHTNAGAPPTGDASASIRQFPLDTIERANLALTLDQFRRLGEGLPLLPQESP